MQGQQGIFTPVTMLNDEQTTFDYDNGNQSYTPRNFKEEYHGEVTAIYALAHSLNNATISLAGGPISGNNYEIDNIPITDFSNRAVIIPSIEAVNEVKVQQNSYDAEMGRTGGGVFNTTLKSGSNTLHGVLQGETLMMLKEHFIKTHGVPKWTVGFGGEYAG